MQNLFLESFKPKNIIDNPSVQELREMSLEQGGIITEFGNLAVVTSVRNRIAKFTEVIMGEPGIESWSIRSWTILKIRR